MRKKNILFLLPYPLHQAPSQRFRVENLLFLLDEAGTTYDLAPFITEDVAKILYQQGFARKAWGIIKCYFRRWATILFKARRYEKIFIHREAAPLGPPIFEWYLAKILRKKIIFDFDDAIWIPNISEKNKIAGLAKSYWKTKFICKWSYKVSAGNDFLCAYAKKSGAKNVIKIPTVVNTETRYNQIKKHQSQQVVVGWTGSHTTLRFLYDLIPVIHDLQKQYSFTFLVIADQKPDLQLDQWTFCPWNIETEIEDLLKIDIGVMPLKNDDWSEGKCGFKLIQYMAVGIPAIASSVGVNKQIIDHQKTGFIADTTEEWKNTLSQLITNQQMRESFGTEGRHKIIAEYSIASQKEKFLGLFE